MSFFKAISATMLALALSAGARADDGCKTCEERKPKCAECEKCSPCETRKTLRRAGEEFLCPQSRRHDRARVRAGQMQHMFDLH